MHNDSIAMLLNASQPSQVIAYLRATRKLDPEIEALIHVKQDSNHHPEGSAYKHTELVLDIAAEISEREFMTNTENAVLRLAALTHDFGKVTHTQYHPDGRITAWGHPEAGVPIAKAFLERSNVNPLIIAQVLPLVNLHMAWVGFYTPDITSKSVRKLIRKLEPSNLIMLKHLVEADMSGRGGQYYKQGVPQRMYDIMTVADTLDSPTDKYPEPLLSGEDIMELTGITPSPLLGKVKAALYKAQLEGKFKTRADGIFLLLNHVVIAENS